MTQLMFTVALGLIAGGAAAAHAQRATGTAGTGTAATAYANLLDGNGRDVGQAMLRQTPNGVLLDLDVKNLSPGVHALHVHEVGRCERPTFESAGGHFNPTTQPHGFFDARGPHAGDLPNIHVPPTRALSVEFLLSDVALGVGASSLIDGNGSAVVIHAGRDDYRSQPAGDAGKRVACGEVVSSSRP